MKRKWTYLGAFFPLSVAVASMAAEAAALADHDASSTRTKTGAHEDQQEKSSAAQDGPDGGGGPKVTHPSFGQTTEEAARAAPQDGLDPTRPGERADVQMSVANTDSSMVASTEVPQWAGQSGGGGGPASKSAETVTEGEPTAPTPTDGGTPTPTDGGTPTPTDGGTPGTTPTVEPAVEPDADAMMILLSGSAEASGEGAASAGQTALDIVDYGSITIAYGQAVYVATGTESDADTYLEVAGADVVYSYEVDNDDGVTDTSAVYFIAIDFEGDPATHPALSNLDWLQMLLANGPFTQWPGTMDNDQISVEGNVALLNVLAQGSPGQSPPSVQQATNAIETTGSSALLGLDGEGADLMLLGESQGVDTFVSVDALLEIGDQFSSVNGTLIGIA
jgi:hypothetical protein